VTLQHDDDDDKSDNLQWLEQQWSYLVLGWLFSAVNWSRT